MKRLLPALCLAVAVWPASAAAPSVAEMFDAAYCDGFSRAKVMATERGAVIRALFKDAEDRWKMVAEVLDLGECPRKAQAPH